MPLQHHSTDGKDSDHKHTDSVDKNGQPLPEEEILPKIGQFSFPVLTPPDGPTGDNLRRQMVLNLQQTVGNAGVQRVLRPDTPRPTAPWWLPKPTTTDKSVRDASYAPSGNFGQRAGAAPVQSNGHHRVDHTIQRVPSGEMAESADEAEVELARHRQTEQSFVSTLSNVSDTNQANRVRQDILSYQPALQEGMSHGEGFATSAMVDTNVQAITTIDTYLATAETQGSALGHFQNEFQRLELDHTRLMTQIQTYAGTDQGAGTNDSPNPVAVAQAQIESTGSTAQEMQQDFREAVTGPSGSGNANVDQEAAEEWRDQISRRSEAVATKQRDYVQAEQGSRAKAARLQQVTLRLRNEEAQGRISSLQGAAAAAKEQVQLIASFVKAGTSLAVTAATGGAVGAAQVIPAAVGVAADVAGYVASHSFDEQIAAIRREVAGLPAEINGQELLAVTLEAEQGKGQQVSKGQEYIDAIKALEDAQDQYRRVMREMGAAADAASGGGNRFEVIAQLLSEADAYIGQANATIQIGQEEQRLGGSASEQVANINRHANGEYGVPYYRPYQMYLRQHLGHNGSRMFFYLITGTDENHTGSAEGSTHGVNPVMERAIQQLTAQRDEIQQYAEGLRQVFNTRASR
jgi:hypothetical protein